MLPSPAANKWHPPTQRSRPITERATVYCGRVVELFAAAADPEAADSMSAYMRRQFPFYGISAPARRGLQRRAAAGLAAPSAADLDTIARCRWARDRRECQYAACDHLRRHVKVLDAGFLATVEHLISKKSWWDTVDALASGVVGPIVAADPGARGVLDRWLDSEDMWLARAAILHQLGRRDATDADWLFAACLRWAGSPEFFLRKAIGWALRDYAKAEPDRVAAFVDAHRCDLSPLSVREATKHLPL